MGGIQVRYPPPTRVPPPHPGQPGGYLTWVPPHQGTPPSRSAGGYPGGGVSRSGTPLPPGYHPPIQVSQGGYLTWVPPHQGTPPSRSAGGVPDLGTPPSGYPPRRGGDPGQDNIGSTCYTAGGMPLAFTQEDFLIFYLCRN